MHSLHSARTIVGLIVELISCEKGLHVFALRKLECSVAYTARIACFGNGVRFLENVANGSGMVFLTHSSSVAYRLVRNEDGRHF